MTKDISSIIAGLTGILGESAVIADPARMTPYLSEPRRRYHTVAAAVARPADTEQVQALCRWANANGVPLIPQSGNTGLVGAQVPMRGDEVIVSLQRLDKVREVDGAAGHMTLEAGVILQHAHEVAEAAGAMFPLSIASQGSARIGGVLSTNAGGVSVLAYGNARELCLGIEAVLADGRVYRGLNALKKDNTGYDIKDLLIGAEGTLGIITAATLKLLPRPVGHETAICSVADPERALALFGLLRQRAGSRLTAFELMPRFGIELQLKHGMLARDPTASVSPWYTLVELSRMAGGASGTLEEALEEALAKAIVSDANVALSESDRAEMWTAREQMSEVQSKEGASIKHDISVPIAAIPRMIAEGAAAAAGVVPGIRPCLFGHMGDGNLHFNFSQPEGMDGSAFMAREKDVNSAVYDVVLKLHGSISAEHGIGQLKARLLADVKDPVAIEMMRVIKQALDPNGILNPGKVLV
ncbi:MAG TPA: FAD-binding oxidoreductase [Devosia sp.]|nr:FAD-binding oxidoreductase [Devosia sp.]